LFQNYKNNRNNDSIKREVAKPAEEEEDVVVETKAAQAVVFRRLWQVGLHSSPTQPSMAL